MKNIFHNEYKIPRRRDNVEFGAQYLAATSGGEVEDHLAEADRLVPRDPAPYRDDDLTGAGFALVEAYDYRTPDGILLYQSLRYEHPGIPGAKQFRQRRVGPVGSGVAWVADAGRVKVPYRWADLLKRPDADIFWCEGEKDANRLLANGVLATTAAGQQLSTVIAKALTGRNVVILPDNDDVGREHAEKARRAFEGFASSIRIMPLPGLPPTGDVSDWLDTGHTVDELKALVAKIKPSGIRITPAAWTDPKLLPRRQWLYRPSYIRQYVSVLVSHGGTGKSSLVLTEALSMVTGKPLLGVQPTLLGAKRDEPLRVWYWCGEDPLDEINLRFAGIALHYGLTEQDAGDRLFLNSGRDMPIMIAETEGRTRNARVNEAVVQQLIDKIQRDKIDVVIIDPFVKCHRLSENDNAGMDLVAETWARIAGLTNCSVLLSHHTRKGKGNGEAYSVDDSRGAIALVDASRSARVLNKMSSKEAEEARIDESERWRYFRSDNGKTSMSRGAEHSDWYKLISFELPNKPQNSFEEDGEEVGVVTPWQYPRTEAPDMSSYRQSAILAAVRGGRWRHNPQSEEEPWVGVAFAGAMGVDLGDPQKMKMIKGLIKEWLRNGWLKIVEHPGPGRRNRKYVEVGPATPPGAPPGAPLDPDVAAWERAQGLSSAPLDEGGADPETENDD